MGRVAVATRPQPGDINHESERTGSDDGHDGSKAAGTDAGAGGRTDGGVLPPEQAHLAAVSGRWGRRAGASVAGPAQRAAQAARTAGAGAGPLCGGTLRRLRPDADGGASEERKGGGGSRDVAALAAGAAGQHTVRRRKQTHRQWRERKPSFGAMVQLDGSHHDWFEGRGPRCVLMVMVDDATNRMRARFFAEETTRASYDVLAGWVRKHGLPASLYVDRDSIYRCEGVGSIAEQLAGQQPQTQFGRAMEQLGIELILANSPQAKGRVERMNGTLQDRLVKELRLAGINDIESGNRFLDGKYLQAFHRQFARVAASPVDVHRAVPRNWNEVLNWEEERAVQGDWTVACEGKRYQLDRQHEALSLVRRKVIVRTPRNGRVQLVYQGKALKWW